MKVSRNNYEDAQKYYRNTYVKLKETGDEVLLVKNASSEEMLFTTTEGEVVGIDFREGQEYEIEYIIPGRCVFQWGDRAYALWRIPARQYYRGMHPENTRFMCFDATGRSCKVSLDGKVLASFVNKPVYYNIDNAVKQLHKGDLSSCALSPDFFISRNGLIKTAVGTTVAAVSFETGTIKHIKLFETELKQLGVFNCLKDINNGKN